MSFDRDKSDTRNVAIVVFDDVEILDFCGPYEVFSVASRNCEPAAFSVYTVAPKKRPIMAINGLSVNPDFGFTDDAPSPDVLVVPGGIGTRKMMDDTDVLSWIRRQSKTAEIVSSVCTGALVLGRAGLLDGLEVTTHHTAYDLLRNVAPSAIVREDCRFVDNGTLVTSAGISAGIDMSLHLVKRLAGEQVANATTQQMEYNLQ